MYPILSCIKGIFRDPLISSTLFPTHSDIIALSERTLLLISLPQDICRNSPSRALFHNKLRSILQMIVSSESTLCIVQYSMEKYNSCYPAHLTNEKSYPNGILNIICLSEYISWCHRNRVLESPRNL